jgi:hypothetical protein
MREEMQQSMTMNHVEGSEKKLFSFSNKEKTNLHSAWFGMIYHQFDY